MHRLMLNEEIFKINPQHNPYEKKIMAIYR